MLFLLSFFFPNRPASAESAQEKRVLVARKTSLPLWLAALFLASLFFFISFLTQTLTTHMRENSFSASNLTSRLPSSHLSHLFTVRMRRNLLIKLGLVRRFGSMVDCWGLRVSTSTLVKGYYCCHFRIPVVELTIGERKIEIYWLSSL